MASQLTGSFPMLISNSLVLEKGLEPKKPNLALKGEG